MASRTHDHFQQLPPQQQQYQTSAGAPQIPRGNHPRLPSIDLGAPYQSQSPPTPPKGPMVPPKVTPEKGLPERPAPKPHNVIQKVQKAPTVPQTSQSMPPPPPKDRDSPPPATLKKLRVQPEQDQRRRSNSLQQSDIPSVDQHRGARLQSRRGTSPIPKGRSVSANPPPGRKGTQEDGRVRLVSSPQGALAMGGSSAHSSRDISPTRGGGSDRGIKRMSWLPGGRSRSNSISEPTKEHAPNATAWIMSPESQADYNVGFLLNGEKVPELWNEAGTVCVHLYPKESGRGPSFKVPAFIVSHSGVFNDLLTAEMSSTPTSAGGSFRASRFGGSLSVDDATHKLGDSPPLPAVDGPGESRLFVPYKAAAGQQGQSQRHDIDRLIAIRNLFAFLTGQPLVGTKTHSTVFLAFSQIAALLKEFDFGNADNSSFGEAVDLSFGFYISQLNMADVRYSREKTIEGLVLGEQMRSYELYNEAFAHAAGKYSAIMDIKSPLMDHVTVYTRQRLERAHIDLLNRQHNVNTRLEAFDFPGVFSGIASSTSNLDYKALRFKNWKTHFGDMRTFVMRHYKHHFGNWPPKARSKKNPFSESGLNRQVLKALYSDLCSVYDLLVDRESLTPRGIDESPDDDAGSPDVTIRALRRILGEFDRSSPPVLPPIPFDTPKIPTMSTILATYNDLPAKEQLRYDKDVKSNELQLIMLKSHNMEMENVATPMLSAFKEFELKQARNMTNIELSEQRLGYWIFIYVVLQCLPMVIVDAPGLKHTEGVEYFLCEPPMGNLPWVEDAGEVRKMWYQTAGGAGIVELSADVVMFSTEATYHRSHCWIAAKQWEAATMAAEPHPDDDLVEPMAPPPPPVLSPLMPPRAFFDDAPMASPPPMSGTSPSISQSSLSLASARRGQSPMRRPGSSGNPLRPSSIAMGLEPLSFEDGAPHPHDRSRTGSTPSVMRPHARRSASSGSMHAMLNRQGGSGSATPTATASPRMGPADGKTGSVSSASTFDSILQGMDNQKQSGSKPKREKKKSIFGL